MITLTTKEHLAAIARHIDKLLAIAEKRTPGEWSCGDGQYVCADDHGVSECYHRESTENERNAAFIASCAGNAEAGWRATKEAIQWLTYMTPGMSQQEAIKSILAAWPVELLKDES